jgi:D-alanine-D-alanine ligase
MDKMKIGLVYNIPPCGKIPYSESSVDVMTQVESIEYGLKKLGHTTCRIPFTKDVAMFLQQIKVENPAMVFNLCETVDENPVLAGHPAAVFELLGIPFTGSPSMALMSTTDKVMTKRLLKGRGIPTPDYIIFNGTEHFNASYLNFPVIVKPRFEDASIGIDQESVFDSAVELKSGLRDFYNCFGPLLVEEYIEGREFNVSVFGYPTARVMPLAEIDFSKYSDNLYHIVGYRAKWDSRSFEYHNTPRKFTHSLPFPLRREIKRIALECSTLFMLRDYGRVDMRVDDHGKVYVLEVNANPCLSPDAGFPASLERAGIKYVHMVQSFIDFVTRRSQSGNQIARTSGQK